MTTTQKCYGQTCHVEDPKSNLRTKVRCMSGSGTVGVVSSKTSSFEVMLTDYSAKEMVILAIGRIRTRPRFVGRLGFVGEIWNGFLLSLSLKMSAFKGICFCRNFGWRFRSFSKKNQTCPQAQKKSNHCRIKRATMPHLSVSLPALKFSKYLCHTALEFPIIFLSVAVLRPNLQTTLWRSLL